MIRCPWTLFCYVLLLVMLCCSPLFAQVETATLSGRITDPQGKSVPKTQVQIVNIETNAALTTETNNEGIYVFTGVKPGRYRQLVLKDGFHEIIKPEFTLYTQDHVEQNFALQIGSTSETVTVSSGGININTTDAAVSTVVDREFVENMPLNGRSFQSLITLAPGVLVVPSQGPGQSGEFSVNGQRTEANYFTVDGVSANTGTSALSGIAPGASGSLPSETALGTTQSLVSIDALQEFRVQTSSYSAEYGRTPGGQISFVTRSGDNDWHGSAFDYFRNEALDANNWFNNAQVPPLPRPPERQNDFGGTFGGPIRIPALYDGHDRSFFFLSYEGLRLQTPQPAVMTQVPSSSLRQNAPLPLQPFLNAFPIPQAGTDLGDGLAVFTQTYSNPSTLDSASVRIDHKLNDNFKVFGRFSDSPSDSGSRFPADLANVQHAEVDVKSLTLGSTNVWSRLTNQLRFNITWNQGTFRDTLDNFGGAVPFGLVNVKDTTGQHIANLDYINFLMLFGNNPSLTLNHSHNSQRQLNITDSSTFVLGSHALSFGIDYRRLWTPLYLRRLAEGSDFVSSTEITQNTPTFSAASSDSLVPLEPTYTNFSAFVQDEWHFNSRLNFSLGLRWELSPPPTDGHGNLPYTLNQISNLATAELAPKGTALWSTTYTNFAPRLGLAYQLRQGSGHQTVVRNGIGLFYDLNNIFGSAGYNGIGYFTGTNFTGVPFPLGPPQTAIPPASVAPPYNNSVYAFDPHLKLPRTLEWNVALEQELGRDQALTVTYVGAAGHRLSTLTDFSLTGINPNFGPFATLILGENGASSNYQSLQLQFQRRLSSGLQVLASYTFSHAIDDASSNFGTFNLIRGNSDFDIRHNFQTAISYEIPSAFQDNGGVLKAVVRHWAIDWRISGRTALPIDIISGQAIQPNGLTVNVRADLVPGVPVYLSDSTAPGGRVVNANAFAMPLTGTGDSPRNFVREFSTWQADFALRREFPLHERLRLQFRAEAFNVFNHPNFGDVNSFLPSGPGFFGLAFDTVNTQLGGLNPLYQIGGPRSLQLALKLIF